MLNGLFDIDNRLDYLTENGDMLPEVHRDKQGGSEAGITQHRIQHGEILLFDEADRIKGGFPEKKQIKCRLFQSRMLEKERSKR